MLGSWRINAAFLSVNFFLLAVAAAQMSDVDVGAKAESDASSRVAEIMTRALGRDYSVVDGWNANGKRVKGVTRITLVPPTNQDHADIAKLGENAVPSLATYVTPNGKPEGLVQALEVKFLGSIGSASTISPLGEALDKRDWQVARLYALDILGKMSEPDALSLVRSVLQDNDQLLAERAIQVSAPIPVDASQLDGSFSLSKASYLAGEPVFLLFTVKNIGSLPVTVRTADPLGFCGGYDFKLQGAIDRDARNCQGTGFAGDCLSGDVVLAPGEARTDRILLNARYDLRQPGRYPMHVAHSLKYGAAGEGLDALELNGIHQDFRDQLEIVIEPSQPDDLKPEFAEYSRQLDSSDPQTKLEAEKIIAYLAPPFMEATILRMLDTPALQSYGVEGLRNLETPSAHRALASFVKNTPPTDALGVYQSALRFLGEIGDSSDVPLLVGVARASAPDSFNRGAALESAGKAGGAAAIPALVAELKDPSIDTQQDAVRALYLTGSRSAVPVLISLLPSREWRVSLTAESGLEVLTHRSGASTKLMGPPPPDTYLKWVRWWKADGRTASIFKADQCGEIEPLPLR